MRVALAAVLAGAALLAALVLLRSTSADESGRSAEHDGDGGEHAVSSETPGLAGPSSDHPPESEADSRAGEVPAPAATAAGGADATNPEPAGTTHVSGFARAGPIAPLAGPAVPLAGHRVEVEDAGGRIEGRAVTAGDGGFRIDGLAPGAKVLRLLGPNQGDVVGAVIDRAWGGDCNAELVQEERRLNLTLPPEGLERVTVVVRGHAARLIRFRLVDDIQRPLGRCAFRFDPTDGIRSIQAEDPVIEVGSEDDGTVCLPLLVEREQSVRLRLELDLGRVVIGGDTKAADGAPRYLPVEVPVRAEPVVQDLGTLVMPRMAGLLVTLVDGATGASIVEATVRVECTGGGVPPTDERGLLDNEGRYVVWSQRGSGDYDLTVEAAGYRAARQRGVLVADDRLRRLQVSLESSR